MKILVLVAHPDDEVIMCGATIDKLINQNHDVFVGFYTRNGQAYFGKERQKERQGRAEEEANKSSSILGYNLNFLGFSDMHLEKDKGLLIQKTIEEIRRVKPDIIITHHEQDKHIDHRTLGGIVPEANFQSGCNLCGGNTVWSASVILQGEIDLEMTNQFDFDVVSSVSKRNVDYKMKAFECYTSIKSEHNTEVEWLFKKLRYLLQMRGRSVGEIYGEAFILNSYTPLKPIALANLSKLLKK